MITSEGYQALQGALRSCDIEIDKLSRSETALRVASLLCEITDEPTALLVEKFQPLIDAATAPPGDRTKLQENMLADDSVPLHFALRNDSRFMFTPHSCGGGGRNFATGLLTDCSNKPLMIMTDPTRPAYRSSIDSRSGEIDVDVPTIGTFNDSDVVTTDDISHRGRLRLVGRFFAPSRGLIEKGVPEIHAGNLEIQAEPTALPGGGGYPIRVAFPGFGLWSDPGFGATYVDCIESGTSGACTNSGASCQWGAKCTTLRLVVTTICVCAMRP